MSEFCKLKTGECMKIWSDNVDENTMHLFPMSLLDYDIEVDTPDIYSYEDIEKLRCDPFIYKK